MKRKSSLPKLTTTTDQTSLTGITTLTTKENAVPLEKVPKLDIQGNKTSKECNNSTSTSSADQDQKKVIKLSEMSMKERLELRAKKFGSNANLTTTSVPGNEKEKQQIETLKKRAERFGCVVSSKIAEIEKQEKLIKRQQRFGSTLTNNSSNSTKDATTVSSPLSANSYAEKAKMRLERFKTTPTATATVTK